MMQLDTGRLTDHLLLVPVILLLHRALTSRDIASLPFSWPAHGPVSREAQNATPRHSFVLRNPRVPFCLVLDSVLLRHIMTGS